MATMSQIEKDAESASFEEFYKQHDSDLGIVGVISASKKGMELAFAELLYDLGESSEGRLGNIQLSTVGWGERSEPQRRHDVGHRYAQPNLHELCHLQVFCA